MSVLEPQLRGLGHTFGGEESVEQKSEEGAETRENQESEAGLGQQDRDDEVDGHEEGWDAEANEEEVKVEEKQDEDDDDEEEAKVKENESAKEKTEVEKQDEDHEKVGHEDQKQQTQNEKDREEDEEEDEDAKETYKERVKEVTENADAKAHQHEEPEGAEQPVSKRDRTLKTNVSHEVEPQQKVNKCSLLSSETRPGLALVDRGAATAAGLGVPPATGHGESTSPLSPLSMAEEECRSLQQKLGKLLLQCDAETLQNQGVEVTDREQNILAAERGAKRGRILSKHPSAEDAPPKKVNKPGAVISHAPAPLATSACMPATKEVAQEPRRRPPASAFGKGHHALAPLAMSAEGGTSQAHQDQLRLRLQLLIANKDYLGAAAVKEEIGAAAVKEELEEKEKCQAEFRRAQDQLKKCLEDEDYTGAAAVKANIAALMSAEPCSQRNHGRSRADWSAATATGHGSQPAIGPTVTSATLARGAAAKRVEKENEEEEMRQAELRRAQDQLKKCLEDMDYTGAAVVKKKIAALMSAAPSIEKEGGGKATSGRASACPGSAQEVPRKCRLTREQRSCKTRWPHS